MKANELMIGDWVQIVEPCKYAGAIGRIKTLIDHKDEENAYFKVFLQNNTIHIGIEDICSEDIRPIPLTTDILEKNGFTDVINPPYKERVLHHVIDGYCVEINVVNKDANMIITPLAERTLVRRRADFILPNPDYVHELQHAIRICGINKEIEL